MTNKPKRAPFPRRARKEAGKAAVPERAPYTHGPATGPLAFLLTYTTFGTWLHGDRRASVDPAHNVPGAPPPAPDPRREKLDRRYFKQPCLTLDARRRRVVHQTILDVAEHRGWTVHALNVRTNHVHLVISATEAPERVMNALKSWATRRMVEAGVLSPGAKAWTRHGSSRHLWKETSVQEACRHVCESQGPDLDAPHDQPASFYEAGSVKWQGVRSV